MNEHIAVIGLSGRFPGAASLETFWQLLIEAKEGLTRFGDSTGAKLTSAGEHNVPVYGAIADVDRFDAEFFKWSPAEAVRTDPQHRLLLEQVHMALESAGYVLRKGLRCGVFASCSRNTYLRNLLQQGFGELEMQGIEEELANEKDHLATKIAYRLDLKGPAMTVQCGCSSSLVAAHLACQSLQARESDLCVVGAATVRAQAGTGYQFVPSGIASADGHCRPFDLAASGTVPGDGVVAVVLRRLADALRDEDDVLAVIHGSATNNDGSRKVGYSAPSVAGQREVLAEAYRRAGIDSGRVSYVEAHGTGTRLGDPIEVRALKSLFASGTGSACALSSVKSRIGHLDAASGLASLATVILALHNARIPGCLNFRQVNPEIDLEGTRFTVSPDVADWPALGGPRIAAVSSFGMGGTNCHMIVGEAPHQRVAPLHSDGTGITFYFSARNPTAAATYLSDLRLSLLREPSISTGDVAATLQNARIDHGFRCVLHANSRSELIEKLSHPPGFAKASAGRGCVLLFPGQDISRLAGAGRAYHSLSAFRAEMDRLCDLFRNELPGDLRSLLLEEVDFGSAEHLPFLQPAIFTYCAALARELIANGVRPRKLLGHSLGELSAIYVAGCLSDIDATRAVALRSRLMLASPQGRTIATVATRAQLRALIDNGLKFSIAATNGPDRYTLSGAASNLDQVVSSLRKMGCATSEINKRFGFHSELLSEAAESFGVAMAALAANAPQIAVQSCITLGDIDSETLADVEYWCSTLTSPVRFDLGLQAAADNAALLEVSPRRTLSQFSQRILQNNENQTATIINFRIADATSYDEIRMTVGRLWESGCEIVRPPARGHRALPSAPFVGERYWPSPRRQNQSQLSRRQPFFWLAPVPYTPAQPRHRAAGTQEHTLIVSSPALLPRLGKMTNAHFQAIPVSDMARTGTFAAYAADSALNLAYSRLVVMFDARDAELRHGAVCAGVLNVIRFFRTRIPALTSFVVVSWREQRPSAKNGVNLCGVNGLLKVLAQEDHAVSYATLSTAGTDEENWTALATFLRTNAPTDCVGYGGHLHQLRVMPLELPAVARSFVATDGFYVIAGMGKIGRALAGYLKSRQAKVLALSRERIDIEDADVRGSTIDWLSRRSVANAIERAQNDWGTIRGVFHTCGITDGASLTHSRNLGFEEFRQQFDAKVETFRVLWAICNEVGADFLLTFSSLAALLGGATFGAYAAANAALNDLVAGAQAAASSTRTISVCWDGWSLGVAEDQSALGASIRAAAFDAESGLAAIEKILASDLCGVFAASQGDLVSRYETWVRQPFSPPAPDTSAYALAVSDQTLDGKLADIWMKHLGVRVIDADSHFLELGGDSLVALRVLSDTYQVSGVQIDLRLFYYHLKFGEYARIVLENLKEIRSPGAL